MCLSVSEAKCGVTACQGSCADAFLPESGCLYTFRTCPPESLRLSPVARSACLWWHCSSADQMSLLHEQVCVGSMQGSLGRRTSRGWHGMLVLVVLLMCDICMGVLHVLQTRQIFFPISNRNSPQLCSR